MVSTLSSSSKSAWPWIKEDVYAAVLDFFSSSKLAKQLNCTSVSKSFKSFFCEGARCLLFGGLQDCI